MRTLPRSDSGERGVALMIAIFLMAALSAMAVSMTYLAQTETAASRNYKTMSQARYAGEAGVHKALNFLMDSSQYALPTNLSSFVTTVSPVTYNGNPVILSAGGTNCPTSSNYPDSSVVTAFASAAQGSLAVGTGTVTYCATAKLVAMRQVTVYGGSSAVTQIWDITGVGGVPIGSIPATVDVSAMLERTTNPAQTYAVFATGAGCGAITMNGNSTTNSYNSQALSSGLPVYSNTNGDVGTNGNLAISGTVDVYGSLSTPRTGVGACTNGSVTAETQSGSATVHNGITQLPQAITFPTPTMPWSASPPTASTPPTTATAISTSLSTLSCSSLLTSAPLSNTGWSCTVVGNNITFTAGVGASSTLTLGNVTLGSNVNLTISPGTLSSISLDVNTISMNGNATLNTPSVPLTMYVAGSGVSAGGDVVDMTGTFSNSSYDPSKFQIVYAGTNNIKVAGNAQAAATIYAPNASVATYGNSSFFGSILSNTFTDAGSTAFHYDTSLQSKYITLGNYVLTSFSWKKY